MDEEQGQGLDFDIDRSDLFLEETFSDLKTGVVKRYSPVNPDGTPDKTRKPVFVGETGLHTPHGHLPLQGLIPAKDLAQAFKRFPEAMQQAMQNLIEEAEKIKKTKDSSIVEAPGSRIIIP